MYPCKISDRSRRKFERDKDELRELGTPLETVTYTINFFMEEVQGYRISQSDLYLRYLKLLRREALPQPPGTPAGQMAPTGMGAVLSGN